MTSSPRRTPVRTLVRERWLAIVLVIVTISFVAQNRNRVQLDLFWLNMRAPLWLALVVIALIGVVVGFLAARQRRH